MIDNDKLNGLPKAYSSLNSKYTICKLNDKVFELIGDCPYNLRWIGSHDNAHIDAYLYCILMLAIEDSSG